MQTSDNQGVTYSFGRFVLDPREKRLLDEGTEVHLPAKEFETLVMLVEHNGRALTKDEMIASLWNDAFVEEGNLAKHISRLRKILDRPGEKFIETIPKHGYRFKADLHRTAIEVDGPIIFEKRTIKRFSIAADAGTDVDVSLRSKTRLFSRNYLIAAISLLLVTAAGIWLVGRQMWPTMTKPQTIAVLPLRSLTDDENDRIFAAGLTDALITKLGSLNPIIVRPAASVAQFSSAGSDPIDLGQKLGVKSILEGSLVQSEGKLRVHLRLIDAQTGEQIWADKFDDAFTNMFDLEDRVSENVARALLPSITDQRVTRRYTESHAAYDAYVKGRYFLNKRSDEGFRRAIGYFTDAVSADPDYALAHVGLADCYILQGVWGTFPPNEVFPKARQAAERALEADSQTAEALVSLAFVEWVNSWDFQKADTDFRRAIDLNPNYATAHHWYSYYLVSMGRIDEAIEQIKKARDLEGPLNVSVNTDIGEIYSWAGRYDEAETYFRNVLELESGYAIGHDVHAINLIKQDRVVDAIPELEKALSLESSPRIMGVLGYAYAQVGQQDRTRKIINDLNVLSTQRYVSPFSIAIAHLGLGETDNAMAQMERAYQQRSDTMAIIDVYPLLDQLRSDQRFVDLKKRVGYSK